MRYGRRLFPNEVCKILQSAGLLEHVSADLREHRVLGDRQKIDEVLELEGRRMGPVERIDVSAPVSNAVRVEVMN